MEIYINTIKSLVGGTMRSNELPDTDGDFQFHNSFPSFSKPVKSINDDILDLLLKTLQVVDGGKRITREDLDDEDNEKISLLNDNLLESADINIEQTFGGNANVQVNLSKGNLFTNNNTKLEKSIVFKPQMNFSDKVDNSDSPFVHKLTTKPHAIVPLEAALSLYNNPYEPEIRHFSPSESQLLSVEPISYIAIEDSTLTWVDNLDLLQDMIEALGKEKSIAIDLEAHADHSFQGFLCLMQISTRNQDYIVDVLLLREHMQSINVITADPAIEKVLHGANMDILWLQRCLGVFIVNMFDTGQAARLLNYPSFGLAYLLKQFCNVQANKQFQLADWRIRPLNDALMKYAQEDTHYLLYISDMLKNELFNLSSKGQLNSNMLHSCYNNSSEICLQVYSKPVYSDKSLITMIEKFDLRLNESEKLIFSAIHKWRDDEARLNDESPNSVLPNHILIKICSSLPTSVSQLHSCCNPVPDIIRSKGHDLINVLSQARNKTVNSNAEYNILSMPSESKRKLDPTFGKSIKSSAMEVDSNFVMIERNAAMKNLGQISFATSINTFSKTSSILFNNFDDNEGANLARQIRDTLSLVKFLSNTSSLIAIENNEEEEQGESERKELKKKLKEEEEKNNDILPLSISSTYNNNPQPINNKKRKLEATESSNIDGEDEEEEGRSATVPFNYNEETSKGSGVYNPFLIKKALKGQNNTFKGKKRR